MNQPVQMVSAPAVPMQAPPPSADAPAKMKYLALIWGLLIVAVATVAIYFLSSANATVNSFTSAFQPQVKYNVVLSGAIGKMNDDGKLVVLSAPLTAEVQTETITSFLNVPVGSAKATVRVPAMVQYYLPLSDVKLDDVYYDDIGKRLVVKIPRPVLDREMVTIESDPEKMEKRTELGWSPFSVFKGPGARAEAMKHLKEAAINQGSHELIAEHAEKNAKEKVKNLLQAVSEEIAKDKLRLDVEFKKQ